MLGARPCCRTLSGAGAFFENNLINCRLNSCADGYFSNVRFHSSPFLIYRKSFLCVCYRSKIGNLKHRFEVISCKSSSGSSSGRHFDVDVDDDDDRYVEAFVLIQETISHHRMRMPKIGIQEIPRRRKFGSIFSMGRLFQVNSLGSAFLHKFQDPAIFLKISCNGDFVLPVIVGQYAVEKLIDSYEKGERGECADLFQLTRDLMNGAGYEVKMVKITDRVANTYFARIVFCKPGESITYSVDARPSDAINVARRCKAPIYVNKEIVLADATRISYGMNRMSNKSVYDVYLDSAADGPDLLLEELCLIRNMNLAAKEEKFDDAAIFRDKLKKLRGSTEML